MQYKLKDTRCRVKVSVGPSRTRTSNANWVVSREIRRSRKMQASRQAELPAVVLHAFISQQSAKCRHATRSYHVAEAGPAGLSPQCDTHPEPTKTASAGAEIYSHQSAAQRRRWDRQRLTRKNSPAKNKPLLQQREDAQIPPACMRSHAFELLLDDAVLNSVRIELRLSPLTRCRSAWSWALTNTVGAR